jgi:hypothetical protein
MGFGVYLLQPFMARAEEIIDPPTVTELLQLETTAVFETEDEELIELEQST